ncbi:hypothetical protein B0H12DRAFT_430204 [Mycena haematopus]|nr:hypothetical protein B0H12DRAFT_430204 [Mycena haematopus]
MPTPALHGHECSKITVRPTNLKLKCFDATRRDRVHVTRHAVRASVRYSRFVILNIHSRIYIESRQSGNCHVYALLTSRSDESRRRDLKSRDAILPLHLQVPLEYVWCAIHAGSCNMLYACLQESLRRVHTWESSSVSAPSPSSPDIGFVWFGRANQ